jgi:hypothetical protein
VTDDLLGFRQQPPNLDDVADHALAECTDGLGILREDGFGGGFAELPDSRHVGQKANLHAWFDMTRRQTEAALLRSDTYRVESTDFFFRDPHAGISAQLVRAVHKNPRQPLRGSEGFRPNSRSLHRSKPE